MTFIPNELRLDKVISTARDWKGLLEIIQAWLHALS